DGRQALLDIRAAGPARRSRGIKAVKRGIPRPGMDVIDPASEQVIGQVTSGNFSPTLRTGIGLALLRSDFPDAGQVAVQVRNRMETFELVDPPFVEPHVR
ncbi:MAG: glycine cleavage T C-terminal barrel domain-containing protein, partial [Brooklawnia sp.]